MVDTGSAALERFLTGRDQRQLFARDRRLGVDAPLVFLPPGGADQFRDACREGHLVCPLTGCTHPKYTAVGGTSGRRHHFKHTAHGAGRHAPERYFHLVGKDVAAAWARLQYPTATVGLEVGVETGQVADVLVTHPDGRRWALEVQYSAIDYSSWHMRDRKYRSAGITPVWLFGHIPPHLVRVRSSDGEVRETALHRQILAGRRGPIHLLNPDTQQVARLLPAADTQALRAVDVLVPWVFDGETAALGVAELSACALTEAGLVSPWEATLARAHAAQRQREQHERERERVAEERDRREREAAATRAARDREREARRRESRATLGKRLQQQAAKERIRLSNAAHPVIAGTGDLPELAGIHGPSWRLLLYRNVLHGRRGHDVDGRHIYGAAKRLLGDVDDASRARVITAWIFELRSQRFLDFASSGRAIVGPIAILADLERLPTADTPQPRRERRVTRSEAGYLVLDERHGVEFRVSRAGRVVGRRRVASDGETGDGGGPRPAAPASVRPAPNTDWIQRRREKHEERIPAWVLQRLPTDTAVRTAPSDWHAEIWHQYINGASGARRPWSQLMALVALYNDGGRSPAAKDALLGFLVHLRLHGAVTFSDAPPGIYPGGVRVL